MPVAMIILFQRARLERLAGAKIDRNAMGQYWV